MASPQPSTPEPIDGVAPGGVGDLDEIRTQQNHFQREFVDAVRAALEEGNKDTLKALADQLYVAELAELLAVLDEPERPKLIEQMGEAFDFAALTELDEQMRIDVLADLPLPLVAAGFAALESDDAVYILEDLSEPAQAEILRTVPTLDRLALQRALDYPEESAGRRMQSNFIAVPPFWTVGRAIDYMREADDLPDEFHDLFVVDPGYRLLGYVRLNRMLRAKRPVVISDIMENVQEIEAETDQEEAAYIFQKYDLTSAAVIDKGGRLVGILSHDDIVDVVQEEAEEDIRALAGVGDEEVSDSVRAIARSRLPWLCVNLATAILASLVIGLFDATLEEMVALAILMPIVASMGGNAGTQTMTVAVRAIATHDLDPYNVSRVVLRETYVGLINGFAFALIMALVALVWFGSAGLGLVIGIAMIVNMLAAALAGILIPLALDYFKVDPAIASSVFVTTVTDVVGFFAFLGLAALWFGI
ncbi:MAG: magnesium transporter [Devosiaceae bacterium]|nr:magnesium transporter [Devosiaceae bacterium MH13]